MLGKRVPGAARVALAIIDDIAAILVIAFFYSSGILAEALLLAGAGIIALLVMQRLGVRNPFAYVAPGVVIWAGLLHAGVHPTLLGVVLGLLTPATCRAHELAPPVERVESALHPWVAYGIMPLFAFANAGVALGNPEAAHPEATTLVTAIVLALFVGKPVGILAFAWLATRSGLGALSAGLSWRGVLLVGLLGGIGFTMSIFIANLAFEGGTLLSAAKLAVLLASLLAAVAGLLLGRFVLFRDD